MEILSKESSRLGIDSHGGKDNGEIILVIVLDIGVGKVALDEAGLATNLGCNLVVGKTSGGEDWNLLAARNGVHRVEGGETSLNHLLRIDARLGINGHALNVEVIRGKDRGTSTREGGEKKGGGNESEIYLSMAVPDPLKMRPTMSSLTGMRIMSPTNSTRVALTSIPLVPSKT